MNPLAISAVAFLNLAAMYVILKFLMLHAAVIIPDPLRSGLLALM
jgi:hypothetical protein